MAAARTFIVQAFPVRMRAWGEQRSHDSFKWSIHSDTIWGNPSREQFRANFYILSKADSVTNMNSYQHFGIYICYAVFLCDFQKPYKKGSELP